MTKEEWYEQLFDRLEHSKFRSGFHLKKKDIDYIMKKDWIRSGSMQETLSQSGKHRQLFQMMGNRHQCRDIRYLSLSMRQLPAVGNVSASGIRCALDGN